MRNFYFAPLVLLLACGGKDDKKDSDDSKYKDAPEGALVEDINSSEKAKAAIPSPGTLAISFNLAPQTANLEESDECDAYAGEDADLIRMPCEIAKVAVDIGAIVSEFISTSTKDVEPVQDGAAWVFTKTLKKSDATGKQKEFFTTECSNNNSKSVETDKDLVLKLALTQNSNGSAHFDLGLGFAGTDPEVGMVTADWFQGVEKDTGKGAIRLNFDKLKVWDNAVFADASVTDIAAFCNEGLADGDEQYSEDKGSIQISYDLLDKEWNRVELNFNDGSSDEISEIKLEGRKDSNEFQFRLLGKGNMVGPGDTADTTFEEKGDLAENMDFRLAYNGDPNDFRVKVLINFYEGDRAGKEPVSYSGCAKYESDAMVLGYLKINTPAAIAAEIAKAVADNPEDKDLKRFAAANESVYCPAALNHVGVD